MSDDIQIYGFEAAQKGVINAGSIQNRQIQRLYRLEMKENLFNDKSYNKSSTVRRKIRQGLFEKNRQTAALSYLHYYDAQTQQLIKESIEGPIPSTLPPLHEASLLTISYYRRNNVKFYRTRGQDPSSIDPHLAYESLLSLVSVEEITQFPNHTQVTQQFENDLGTIIKMPYPELQEMAAIVAGNLIIGREPEILQIINSSSSYLWLLINHIYERRISFKHIFPYLEKEEPIIYRAVYEMTNNKKDEIIYSIISSEQLVTKIMQNLSNANPEIQTYAIRILGNILAEAEDYAGDLTKYQILDKIYPLLSNKSWEMRRDGCWLLANYVFETAPANELLCKQNIMERLMIMYRNQQKTELRVELYYILSHLVMYGSKPITYKLALEQNFLEQCSSDLDLEEQDLNLVVLNLVEKLVELGEEYVSNEDEELSINPFSLFIKRDHLKLQITSKTYSYNSEISEISSNILDKIGKEDNDFGMI